jgi:apolipoprotein N-acyltransferase
MAVFRAVENRRSMVRSTASGQTCAIDPNGRVLAMAEPFTEAALTATVPVITPNSPYTTWGDIWAKLFTAAAFVLLIIGTALGIIRKGRK